MTGNTMLTVCVLLLSLVIIIMLNVLKQRLTKIEENLEKWFQHQDTRVSEEISQALTPVARKLAAEPVSYQNAPVVNRNEVIAAISAAIAEDLGTGIKGIRILSFQALAQASQPIPHHQEIIAAISAAMAENLGTDTRGSRILSLGKLEPIRQADTDRQMVIAAVSAAITEDLGTGINAIRVLSFRQV